MPFRLRHRAGYSKPTEVSPGHAVDRVNFARDCRSSRRPESTVRSRKLRVPSEPSLIIASPLMPSAAAAMPIFSTGESLVAALGMVGSMVIAAANSIPLHRSPAPASSTALGFRRFPPMFPRRRSHYFRRMSPSRSSPASAFLHARPLCSSVRLPMPIGYSCFTYGVNELASPQRLDSRLGRARLSTRRIF